MFSVKKILLVLSITGIIFIQPLGAETPDAVKKAEGFMQTGEYRKAIEVLDREPVPQEQRPYTQWLKALSLFKMNDLGAALGICDTARKQGGENQWLHKMEFLAADIYTRQKNFRKAEEVYEAEAKRLLSEDRKQQIAAVYVNFAKTLAYQPKPDEPDKPEPNFKQAYLFYQKALELEIGLALGEDIRFRMAEMKNRDRQFGDAASEYRRYLEEFDPAWQRTADGRKELPFIGLHCAEARYRLAECLLAANDRRRARTVLEDLIALVSGKNTAAMQGDLDGREKLRQWKAMAMRRLPAACGFPTPNDDVDLESGLARTDAFLKEFPDDSLSVLLAWQAVQALTQRSRTAEALARANGFFNKANFSVREKETADMVGWREEFGFKESPVEMFDRLQKEALYLTGTLEFARGDFGRCLWRIRQAFSQWARMDERPAGHHRCRVPDRSPPYREQGI
jgi:thioredoxin-like negative regulator of GroEL